MGQRTKVFSSLITHLGLSITTSAKHFSSVPLLRQMKINLGNCHRFYEQMRPFSGHLLWSHPVFWSPVGNILVPHKALHPTLSSRCPSAAAGDERCFPGFPPVVCACASERQCQLGRGPPAPSPGCLGFALRLAPRSLGGLGIFQLGASDSVA